MPKSNRCKNDGDGDNPTTTQQLYPVGYIEGGCVCWGGGGGRIVAASEMLRPSVETCAASSSDAPVLQKVV